MANPHRGEVPVEVGGRTLLLRYSANACAELENQLDRGIVSIVQEIMGWSDNPETIRLGTFRALLWAGLRSGNRKLTLEQAGDLIDEAGGMVTLIGPVSEAFSKAFPQADDEVGETKGDRPTNGTGSPSNETTSPSDMTRTVSGTAPPGN